MSDLEQLRRRVAEEPYDLVAFEKLKVYEARLKPIQFCSGCQRPTDGEDIHQTCEPGWWEKPKLGERLLGSDQYRYCWLRLFLITHDDPIAAKILLKARCIYCAKREEVSRMINLYSFPIIELWPEPYKLAAHFMEPVILKFIKGHEHEFHGESYDESYDEP